MLITFNISVEYLFPSTSRTADIVNKMVEDQVLDRAYAALADPTRRSLLKTLRQGDARITDLAAPLPMTFAGVSRHIGVLESAGLVRREVRGREHWLSLQPDGLTMAQQWIDEQTDFWSTRADALSARLRRKGRDTMTEAATVRVQRVMPATPEVVFDQWLDPESLEEWMCPRPVRVVDVAVEPRIGGTVRFDVDDSGTRVLITGQFLTIDRPHLLRFTWSNSNWPDPTVASVVNVAFEPVGDDETLMSIEHSLLPPEEFESFDNGWTLTFDQLAAFLHGG